jgi:hypothetical protein
MAEASISFTDVNNAQLITTQSQWCKALSHFIPAFLIVAMTASSLLEL